MPPQLGFVILSKSLPLHVNYSSVKMCFYFLTLCLCVFALYSLMQFGEEVFGTLYNHAPSLLLGTSSQECWTHSNLSPLIEAVRLNVFCLLGVSLLRTRPQPSTGLLGGSEAPVSISFNCGKVTATDRNTGHQHPKSPTLSITHHSLSFCLLLVQTLPVDAIIFFFFLLEFEMFIHMCTK